MEKGARRTGRTAWEIAALYTRAFEEDLAALHIEPPDVMPRATEHIAEQIGFIADLERDGYAYRTNDGIYFDTSRQPDYGILARLDKSGLEAGKRVDVGDKRNATDFALWKFSPAGSTRQMEWDSPWGKGFPGWHIECSAMAQKYLGDFFDIHCGGEDHIPSITRTRSRKRRRVAARVSRTSGCTAISCSRTTRRWRSQPVNSCASRRSSSAAAIRSRSAICASPGITGRSSTSRSTRSTRRRRD
jgi:hypothetical protein